MSNTIDLLEAFESADSAPELSLVRLSENETAVAPFTTSATQVDLHFCEEPELRSYVRCNGKDCVLCKLGKGITQKCLIPVYQPIEDAVGVLAVSPVRTPRALLPQLFKFLKEDQPHVLFVTRKGQEYRVEGRPLKAGERDGRDAIAAYQRRLEAGGVALEEVYPAYSNDELLAIDSLALRAELKGVAA